MSRTRLYTSPDRIPAALYAERLAELDIPVEVIHNGHEAEACPIWLAEIWIEDSLLEDPQVRHDVISVFSPRPITDACHPERSEGADRSPQSLGVDVTSAQKLSSRSLTSLGMTA